MLDFPNKKYTVIYVDPPWSFSDKQKAGCRGAFFKYPVQSKEWIESLPVIDIVADDAFLFLWVTMPLLQQGLDLFPKWDSLIRLSVLHGLRRIKKPILYFGVWVIIQGQILSFVC